jgi:glycosyltransferase involved in cell wall biosynthesis
MRIGIDAAPLGVRSGGIKRYTAELIEGITQLEERPEVVLYRAPQGIESKRWFPDLKRGPVYFRHKQFVDIMHLLGARGTIDLYHGTNYSIPLLTRIPTVVTVHDLTVQLVPESHPPARRLWHRLLPLICRRATRVIVDSYQTREDLLRLYRISEDKVDVIHLGVGDEFHPILDEAQKTSLRAKLGLPARFMLYLGALEPRKNLESLIDAFAQLRRRGRGEALVLAGSGDGDYETSLKDRAIGLGLTLADDVHFLGHVDDADLAALYSTSDLFVFPSNYEGFGLPPLEAMACGVPVVLARNSSLAEVYEGTCAMAEDGGPETLSKTIEAVLEDSTHQAELVRLGLEFAQSRRWKAVCEATFAVYERALDEGPVDFRLNR